MNISIERYLTKIKDFFPKKLFVEEKITDCLGLDIGASCVKIAKVKSEKDKLSLVNFGISNIKNNDVSAAIKEAIEKANVNTKMVNIGLSGQGVIVRYVLLPRMPLKELKQSVVTEADKYIPFPMEDVLLDCHILKELAQENKMFVLIATAKKDLIQERLRLLSALKLEPAVIDVDSIAMVNCFNELRLKSISSKTDRNSDDKPYAIAILNIGATISCLSILEDGLPKFSRDIYIGGNDFTKRIGYVHNLDFESAEELKCRPNEEQIVKNLEACDVLFNNLSHELRLSFDYYETENNTSINKLYLSGGGVYLKGFDDSLNKNLGVETEIWDPSSYLEINPNINIDDLKPYSSKLTIAIGLALR